MKGFSDWACKDGAEELVMVILGWAADSAGCGGEGILAAEEPAAFASEDCSDLADVEPCNFSRRLLRIYNQTGCQ
jgi:hypothetical protein